VVWKVRLRTAISVYFTFLFTLSGAVLRRSRLIAVQISSGAIPLQTPMSPVYPGMLEQIQQLSVNGGGRPPSVPSSSSYGNSPGLVGPHNGFFGAGPVDDFTAR